MFRIIEIKFPVASILEKKPAEGRIGIIDEAITIKSTESEVTEDLAINRKFERHASNPFALGDNRAAGRSHALQAIYGRSLVLGL